MPEDWGTGCSQPMAWLCPLPITAAGNGFGCPAQLYNTAGDYERLADAL
jgi:hypothetical protein